MDKLASSPHSSEHARQVLLKTLEIITGKWRLLIIYQLIEQKLRYGELRRSVPQISEKVLIDELKELEALGFLQKESFPEIPLRVEYGLTEKAHKIMPILHRLTLTVEIVFS